MADKTSADCHVANPQAYHNSGKRNVNQIELIVLHDTEGGTAHGVATYFASAKSGGSAHLVVDDNECWRCLANDVIAWGAPGANTNGFHIEQCGYAGWSQNEWIVHSKTLLRAAYKTAFHCHKFGIPPVFVEAAGLKAGKKGVTTHAQVSLAFPNSEGNHTDPGSNWPRAYFMGAVRRYYKQLTPAV
jgi:hypothetical protein